MDKLNKLIAKLKKENKQLKKELEGELTKYFTHVKSHRLKYNVSIIKELEKL